MQDPEKFTIGVSLVDATADPIVLEFQQELYQDDRIAVRAPRGLLLQLGADEFAAHITDYYFAEHPAEATRVGRERVLAAVRNAIEWGRADSQHPRGLL